MTVPADAPDRERTSGARSFGAELRRCRSLAAPDRLSALLEARGLDLGGFFCGLALPKATPEGLVRALAAALQRTTRAVFSVEPDHLLVVVQGPETSTSSAQLTHALGAGPVGIGMRRGGPDGAAQTALEASQALSLAVRRGGLVRVDEEWPLLLLLRSLDDVQGYLGPALDFARSRPHLADGVRAFADSGFSVTGAAQRIYLTPNAVVYRLRQWTAGTGWDPRTYKGLVRSLACLEVLELERSEPAPDR
jgi:sugar diacid utilization regulator